MRDIIDIYSNFGSCRILVETEDDFKILEQMVEYLKERIEREQIREKKRVEEILRERKQVEKK
jgi:hypothetical protein